METLGSNKTVTNTTPCRDMLTFETKCQILDGFYKKEKICKHPPFKNSHPQGNKYQNSFLFLMEWEGVGAESSCDQTKDLCRRIRA